VQYDRLKLVAFLFPVCGVLVCFCCGKFVSVVVIIGYFKACVREVFFKDIALIISVIANIVGLAQLLFHLLLRIRAFKSLL